MGVEPKIGVKTPKTDGEHIGKPYFFMDDLGYLVPLFLETPTKSPGFDQPMNQVTALNVLGAAEDATIEEVTLG